MKTILKVLSICMVFSIVQDELCNAQSLNVQKLDSFFNVLENSNKSMCAISIYRNGMQQYHRSIGFIDSNLSGKTKPGKDTKYRIGSVTKTFTAVIIFQLIEENKLRLDMPLATFYPDIPGADSVTIGQMLNHHSGLKSYKRAIDLEDLKKAKTEDDLVRMVSKGHGKAQDRISGGYSNLNYILLGFIIEKVTGTTFEEQLKQRITGKLALANTYNLPGTITPSKNEAHSYNFSTGAWKEDRQVKWNFYEASGDIVSTPDDLSVFFEALFSGKLVSKTSLTEMMTIKDKFGCGLLTMPFGDKKGIGNSGRTEGFVTSVAHFPSDSLTVAIVVNGQIYPLNDILIGALSIAFEKPYAIPTFDVVKLNDTVIPMLCGDFSGKEAPLKVSIIPREGSIHAMIKKKGGIFKMKIDLDALSSNRFIYDRKGIFLDFSKKADGKYNSITMTIFGAKVHLERNQP